MDIKFHKFLGLPKTKPRVWIDLSSVASKRAGLAMHSPGRRFLKLAVKILKWFAWLPVEKIVRGPIRFFNELDGHEVIEKAVGDAIKYLALYMGNDSVKTKLTVLVGMESGESLIVKLGRTPEAAMAIRNEVEMLIKLSQTSLCAQVPFVHGEVGHDDVWTWSIQSILPKGQSPLHLQKEHYDFLRELKSIGISHGDFTPWNCSIVGGRLYAWDWEDSTPWVERKDVDWFKSQVKNLLGVGE